jgi:hypothetical protein
MVWWSFLKLCIKNKAHEVNFMGAKNRWRGKGCYLERRRWNQIQIHHILWLGSLSLFHTFHTNSEPELSPAAHCFPPPLHILCLHFFFQQNTEILLTCQVCSSEFLTFCWSTPNFSIYPVFLGIHSWSNVLHRPNTRHTAWLQDMHSTLLERIHSYTNMTQW